MNKSYRLAILLIMVLSILSGCGAKTAGGYYKDGLKLFQSGNYEKAEESFQKAIDMNPDRAEYYINYAMTLIQLGEYDDAIKNFDKIILNKNNIIVKKNNKKAYRGKGIAYYKAHNYKEAITQFEKALAIDELSDLNLDILYYKGESEKNAGLYAKAAATYTTVLSDNKSDADTYNSRAFVYRKLGEYEKSLDDYDKAIELKKDNYDYYFGKYFLLLEMNDEESAADVLNKAVDITVDTGEDKFNLAKVHYYMGDYNTAIIEFSEAFRNGFASAYYYLGDIYEKKEDYASAVNNYRLFIEDPTSEKSAVVYNQIGACLIRLGEYEEAINYIEEGLNYNDLNYEQALQRNKIVAYEKLSDFEEAYNLMTDYLKQYSDDTDAVEEMEFLKTRLPEASIVKEEE